MSITGAIMRKNVQSVAYEASRIIKAASGVLYGFDVYSSLGAAQWIQLHDSATVPADTAVPIWIGTVATIANLPKEFGLYGLAFANGIVICNSTTGPTKTLGATNCWFQARYQ